MRCQDFQDRLERRWDDFQMRAHTEECPACQERLALVNWSRQVMLAAEQDVTPPAMAAVWAAVRRATNTSWEFSLTRSFRRLAPYLVAVTVLFIVVAAFQPGIVTSRPSRYASALAAGPDTKVASVLAPDLAPQKPGDVLGIGGR